MIRPAMLADLLVLTVLWLVFVAAVLSWPQDGPVLPVTPPAQELQPPRVDRSFVVLNARSLSDRRRAGVHCAGELGAPAVLCLAG